MPIKSIRFKNYRSFVDGAAEIPLDQEFVGIVGVNNAGKSTLLRAFWEIRPILLQLSQIRSGSADFTGLLSPSGAMLSSPQLLAGERIAPHAGPSDVFPEFTVVVERTDGGSPELVQEVTVWMLGGSLYRMRLVTGSGVHVENLESGQVSNVISPNPEGVAALLSTPTGEVTLRWNELLPDIGWLARSIYIGAFRNSINSGGTSYYDLDVGQDFIRTFNEFKNGTNHEFNEAIQAMSEQIAEIFGVQRFDVSASPDGSHLRYMMDGVSFRGSELGAGVAQFVMVAANVLVKKPSILLIDEPELNLHASLQLRFLTLLAQYVDGPVIFSSHSLGLTRAASDRILIASRNSRGSSKLQEYELSNNLNVTLGELGYGGLHDATYKAVVLVEGVTEVRAVQELLLKYGVRNEVAIVQLGGDSMAIAGRDLELAELRKLSEHVFAIVDGEGTSPIHKISARRAGFRQSCIDQGIGCHVLERRALENYLNHVASDAVMLTTGSAAIGPYDPTPTGWSKSRNWRAIRGIPRSHFDSTDLGAFLSAVSTEILAL